MKTDIEEYDPPINVIIKWADAWSSTGWENRSEYIDLNWCETTCKLLCIDYEDNVANICGTVGGEDVNERGAIPLSPHTTITQIYPKEKIIFSGAEYFANKSGKDSTQVNKGKVVNKTYRRYSRGSRRLRQKPVTKRHKRGGG